jgi:hypothetical protein
MSRALPSGTLTLASRPPRAHGHGPGHPHCRLDPQLRGSLRRALQSSCLQSSRSVGLLLIASGQAHSPAPWSMSRPCPSPSGGTFRRDALRPASRAIHTLASSLVLGCVELLFGSSSMRLTLPRLPCVHTCACQIGSVDAICLILISQRHNSPIRRIRRHHPLIQSNALACLNLSRPVSCPSRLSPGPSALERTKQFFSEPEVPNDSAEPAAGRPSVPSAAGWPAVGTPQVSSFPFDVLVGHDSRL